MERECPCWERTLLPVRSQQSVAVRSILGRCHRELGIERGDIVLGYLSQLPNALTPVPCATRETHLVHHAQVFGDRLTSDVGSPVSR